MRGSKTEGKSEKGQLVRLSRHHPIASGWDHPSYFLGDLREMLNFYFGSHRKTVRKLGLIMMLLGVTGTLIGYPASMSPWAFDFNLWLYPDFLEQGAYPELGFAVLFFFSFVLWILGALLRNRRSMRNRASEFWEHLPFLIFGRAGRGPAPRADRASPSPPRQC